MASPTVLRQNVVYSQQDVETAKDVGRLAGPLQSILSRFGVEQAGLRERLASLQRQNRELEQSNGTLTQRLEDLRRSQAAAPQQPTPAPAAIGTTSVAPQGGMEAGYPQAAPEVIEPEHDSSLQFLEPPENRIAIHEQPVHSIAIVPGTASIVSQRGATIFASASWDATVKFYDLATNEVVKTFGSYEYKDTKGKMAGLYCVAFAKSADVPNVFGCTSSDKNVYLWNAESGKLLHKFGQDVNTSEAHSDEVNGLDFHETQKVMCTVSDDTSCRCWDFQEGKILRVLGDPSVNKAVYGVTFLGSTQNSPLQYCCATCSFDSKARIWDLRDKKIVATVTAGTDDVIGIDYSVKNQWLATGCDDGQISIWDSRTWKRHLAIDTRKVLQSDSEPNEVKRIAWSPCGKYLAAACSAKCVLVYKDGKIVKRLDGRHEDTVFDVAWGVCPRTNNYSLVSASHDHTSDHFQAIPSG
jgi:WD40 repeat protein